MLVVGTGHRPERLIKKCGSAYKEFMAQRKMTLRDIFRRIKPDAVISGCARGFDICIAEAAIQLGIDVVAAVPYKDHSQFWAKDDKQALDHVLQSAKQVELCADIYSRECFLARDRWMISQMVDGDLLLALFDGEKTGGTWQTIWYAEQKASLAAGLDLGILNVFAPGGVRWLRAYKNHEYYRGLGYAAQD